STYSYFALNIASISGVVVILGVIALIILNENEYTIWHFIFSISLFLYTVVLVRLVETRICLFKFLPLQSMKKFLATGLIIGMDATLLELNQAKIGISLLFINMLFALVFGTQGMGKKGGTWKWCSSIYHVFLSFLSLVLFTTEFTLKKRRNNHLGCYPNSPVRMFMDHGSLDFNPDEDKNLLILNIYVHLRKNYNEGVINPATHMIKTKEIAILITQFFQGILIWSLEKM
ncbi:hypothetical protein ACJX0J_007263, partial [Zea mays]